MATTTSKPVFVWIWLPGSTVPVPAGVLERRSGSLDLSFRYGNLYRERSDAISLFNLPLEGPTWHEASHNLRMPSSIRDASPDSWGRRVIMQRQNFSERDSEELDEEIYLLHSGSNRLGSLDFQTSASEYFSRSETATLDELLEAADLVLKGTKLPENLEQALLYGTAIGGARPKALLESNGQQLIAKFSTNTDPYDVVGAEAASIYLARELGIPVTDAQVVSSLGRKVLLLERFDREELGTRRSVVSGLTMLDQPEHWVPTGSYPDLLDVLLQKSATAHGVGEQVFLRAAFNVAIGNTDDHLRNHAAFWDGGHLELAPAYDLSPVMRTGESAAQALGLNRDGDRTSSLEILIKAAAEYRLDRNTARAIANKVIDTIESKWLDAADFANISKVDREMMWRKLFLNPGSVRI